MRSGVHTIFAHAPICVLTIICWTRAGERRDLAGDKSSDERIWVAECCRVVYWRGHKDIEETLHLASIHCRWPTGRWDEIFCNIVSDCKQIREYKMSIAKLNNLWILKDICFNWCFYFWFVCVCVLALLLTGWLADFFHFTLTLSPLKVLWRKSESEIFECSHSRACLTSTPPFPHLWNTS